MTAPNYKRTKLACYTAYFTMSSVFSLPPLLFVTLHELYGISYTLLGTLVLTNFCTQLTIDLVFTFFSKHFNVAKTVRIMPILTSLGMFLYALSPLLLPEHTYLGLLLGTIIFSVSAGLSEVLLSPTIAAIPSGDPQKAMSFLHSLYAFGVVAIVAVSTLFLRLFGQENWMYLMMFLGLLPLIASILFMLSPIPEIPGENGSAGTATAKRKTLSLALFVACIFFGSCAENVMSNWISSYTETALHIDKAAGDLLGMAVFAVLLGMGRIAYSKFGKNIRPVLLGVGVAAYALMAAGGDLGASVAPQLMGVVIDKVSASAFGAELAASLHLSVEQVGLKAGMLVSAIFPFAGTVLILLMLRYFKKQRVL